MFRWLNKKMENYLSREVNGKRGYLCDFGRISQEIIPGDVLLIEGRNRISKVIKRITQSPWTHAALYIGRIHSIEDVNLRRQVQKFYKGKAAEQLLIESQLGKGTIVTPISAYQDDHIRICRAQGLSHDDAQKVVMYAIKHLGKHYDKRQFFDLGRYLMANPLIPRKMLSSLFHKKKKKKVQTNEEICSTMIAEAFASIHYPILPTIHKSKKRLHFVECNPKLIVPSDFDYSPYFAIIKYPFYSERGPYYTRLPWSKEDEAEG